MWFQWSHALSWCVHLCAYVLISICARINNIYLAHSIKLLQQISIQHRSLSCCLAPGMPPCLMVVWPVDVLLSVLVFNQCAVAVRCCCCYPAINLVETFRLLLIQAIEHMCPPAADCVCPAASAVLRCGMPHSVTCHTFARTYVCICKYVPLVPLLTARAKIIFEMCEFCM